MDLQRFMAGCRKCRAKAVIQTFTVIYTVSGIIDDMDVNPFLILTCAIEACGDSIEEGVLGRE